MLIKDEWNNLFDAYSKEHSDLAKEFGFTPENISKRFMDVL